jgi:predicted molibdopterin-dependent oxidoreductase YjgC
MIQEGTISDGLDLEYIPTTCPYCGSGCGFYLKVKVGELVGVDRADSASKV